MIRNKIDNKVYVGSTISFSNREKAHFKSLLSHAHYNQRLQAAFDKHGEEVFVFEIVELVPYQQDIKDKEDFYIKAFDSKKNGYNISDATFGDTLRYHPRKDEIFAKIAQTKSLWTDEQKEEINAKKSCPGELNGMYGTHRVGSQNPMWGKSQSRLCKDTVSKKNRGKVVVKDRETGILIGQVDITHEKYLSGEWVPQLTGTKASAETCLKQSLVRKRLGIKPPNQAGKFWWNDGISNLRSKESPGVEWNRGRLPFKRKQNG